ncbi:MAG: hypothetical protein WAV40_02610 [Microgenomates group bacterium]
MPDTLNKQSLINLLIDSPLREPIKINLIDIINNTSEADLPKVYSTITKELEIFQKATERRMKLAEETIAKLGGTAPPSPMTPEPPEVPTDLPPLPTPPVATPEPSVTTPPLSVPTLDLPPMPASTSSSLGGPTPTPTSPPPVAAPVAEPPAAPAMPTPQPLGAPAMTSSSDEDALAEIQKELDSLKSTTASEISSAATPTPLPQA